MRPVFEPLYRMALACFAILNLATSLSTARAEQLAYYSFDGNPSTKGLFADITAGYVRAHKVVASGISGDTSGNGTLHLGQLSQYGDVTIQGRAIFRLHSFGNRSLKLTSLLFQATVIGQKADKFRVIINDQVVYEVLDLRRALTTYQLTSHHGYY